MKAKENELIELLNSSSRCGDEFEYAAMLKEKLEKTGFYDNVYIDRLSNVIGVIGDRKNHTVMLEAHFDEISLVVADINEKGFLRVARVGGVDRRCMLSCEVTVNGLNGVFCSVPPHLCKKGDSEKVPKFSDLYIDLGLDAKTVKEKVSIGDRIEFVAESTKLLNGRVAGKALDNKACAYAVTVAAEKLGKLIKSGSLDMCVVVLLASQEEIGSFGAKTGTFDIYPDEAIVSDVTFAKQNGVKDAPDLGSGVVVERSAFFDKRMTRKLMDIADEKKIPHTINVEARAYGTDGDTVFCTRQGIPTAVLSLPQRYMHTPVEVVDIADIEATADLMIEYVKGGGINGLA